MSSSVFCSGTPVVYNIYIYDITYIDRDLSPIIYSIIRKCN